MTSSFAARRAAVAAALAAAISLATGVGQGAELQGRIVFKNGLPRVKSQDEEVGIFFVKLVFLGGGPLDPNSGRPEFAKLPELLTITYGRTIEGVDLPGSGVGVTRKEIDARKEADPNTLIVLDNNRRRVIYRGAIPREAAWMRIRYDAAVRRQKDDPHVRGAGNWIALPLPVLDEDRWVKLDPVPDPCPTRIVQVTALVKGTFPDERDFTAEVQCRCE